MQKPVPNPGYRLCFWLAIDPIFQWLPPSLGPINLLEWLTELREIAYLLDHWFIIWGCNSGTARWTRCREKSVWNGTRSFQGLFRCDSLSPHLQVFTKLEALLMLSFSVWTEGFSTEAAVIKSRAPGDWFSPVRKSRGGTESSNLLFSVGSSGNQPPF